MPLWRQGCRLPGTPPALVTPPLSCSTSRRTASTCSTRALPQALGPGLLRAEGAGSCQAGASVGGASQTRERWPPKFGLMGLVERKEDSFGRGATEAVGGVCVCTSTCHEGRHLCSVIIGVIRKHLGFMTRPCGHDKGIRNPVCLQIPAESRTAETLSFIFLLVCLPIPSSLSPFVLATKKYQWPRLPHMSL